MKAREAQLPAQAVERSSSEPARPGPQEIPMSREGPVSYPPEGRLQQANPTSAPGQPKATRAHPMTATRPPKASPARPLAGPNLDLTAVERQSLVRPAAPQRVGPK